MTSGEDRNDSDFYAILGLQKECTPSELKNAYRMLAKRWHPDRCSGAGNSKFVEEANKKFQAIQEAYSVLSDETKRFLYDVGVYDKDDDDNNHGMDEFLNEMMTMMSETQPGENGNESFEQLQVLFEEMFQTDVTSTSSQGSSSSCSLPYVASLDTSCFTNNKRSSSELNISEASSSFNAHFQSFCVGSSGRTNRGRMENGEGTKKRMPRRRSG